MRGLCVLLCFGLVGALQLEKKLAEQGPPAAKIHGHQWVTENCRRLSNLLRQKSSAIRKLGLAAAMVLQDKTLSQGEKLFRLHTLEIFQRELNESEHSLFQAVDGLQRVLKGNFRDVVNMKESSRQRLDALREAAIKV